MLKNDGPFFEHDSQKLFCIITQRIGFSSNIWCKIQRNGPFFTNESKTWTSFRNMSVRIKPFWKILEELIIWKIMKIKKLFDESRKWTLFFYMTYRTEPFFQHDSKKLKIFFFFENMFKDFVSIIHRIELFFSVLLQEWNIWEDDSKKKWTFWFTWPKELNLFSNLTQRVDPFFQNITQKN